MHDILLKLKEWFELLAPFGVVGGVIWNWWGKHRVKELKDLYDKVKIISEEFRPNGGSTLRDAINRIETKVTINEQKTLAIIKSLPLGTWVSDKNGKWVDVNKSLCNIITRTESELKGDNWLTWVSPGEKNLVFDEWQKCTQNIINFDLIFSFVLPDGKLQKVHGIAYQLLNEKNELLGFLGTLSATLTTE